MEPYAIITPTRDRPKMLEFCKYQVSQFTIQPEKHYIIDYPPISADVDISERVFMGVQKAKEDGIDLVFIIEDDDFYANDYIEQYYTHPIKHPLLDYQFFGCDQTDYYNLGNRTYQKMIHAGRSSLFVTGFRVSALDCFQWPKNTPFVDIALWKYANSFKKRFIIESWCVGIKGHGFGKTGGKGHGMKFQNSDYNYRWLQNNVTPEAFEFYMSLI